MALAPAIIGALLVVITCVYASSIPPPYLPGCSLLIGEFQIPAINVTGSQRIYVQYNEGASLSTARIDEIFTDTNDPPLNLPRYDAGFIGSGYSYYAWASATEGLSCVTEPGILSIIPQQTWFLLFCTFNGTSVFEGTDVNLWSCNPTPESTTIWYTANLFPSFMRMEYYLNSQPAQPALAINWISVIPYSSFPSTVFTPPAVWNCSSATTAPKKSHARPLAVGALGWAIKMLTEKQVV